MSVVITKFLITMAWVIGSCGAIFLMLFAYKKLTKSSLVRSKQVDVSKNLSSPDTIDDAAKLFIEKF